MRKHHGNEQLLAELNSSGCRTKVRHPSKAHAMAAGRRTLTDPTNGDYERRSGIDQRRFVLTVYKCKVCGYWHCGHSHRRHQPEATSIVHAVDATPLERALADALRPYLHAAD